MIHGTAEERMLFIFGRGDKMKINLFFCEIEIDWRAIVAICICIAIVCVSK